MLSAPNCWESEAAAAYLHRAPLTQPKAQRYLDHDRDGAIAGVAARFEAPLAQGLDRGLIQQGDRLDHYDVALHRAMLIDNRAQHDLALHTLRPR